MKHYKLDTEFTFGKFTGKTVRQILDLEPSYIEWCAINLDYFYISDTVLESIITIKPNFILSEEGKQKLDEKYSTWQDEQQNNEQLHYEHRAMMKEYESAAYYALTEGQSGNYDDWCENGGDFDNLLEWMGH